MTLLGSGVDIAGLKELGEESKEVDEVTTLGAWRCRPERIALAALLMMALMADAADAQRRRPAKDTATVPPPIATRTDRQQAARPRMPNVRKMLLDEAREALQRLRPALKVEYRDTRNARLDGRVLDQQPDSGAPIARPGLPVMLTVYRYVAPSVVVIDVPKVVGLLQGDAEGRIVASGLRVGRIEGKPSDAHPSGVVSDQHPHPPAQLDRGAPVDLIISTGPVTVPVPDLVGRTRAEAGSMLRQAGLQGKLSTVLVTDATEGRVVQQEPAPGTAVPSGAVVLVTVGAFPRVRVPDVRGLDPAQAWRVLEDSGLKVITTTSASESALVQRVLRQEPDVGTTVRLGTPVTLTLPVQAEQRWPMPNVRRMLLGEARALLQQIQPVIQVDFRDTTDSNLDGRVVAQRPTSGTPVQVGASVRLLVHRYVAPVVVLIDVPSVIGLRQGDGESRIVARGLRVGRVTASPSDAYAAGAISDQQPPSGARLDRGAVVDLVVSTGPVTRTVPDVRGLDPSIATRLLQDSGLSATITESASESAVVRQVLRQDPEAGSRVRPGSAVVLTIPELAVQRVDSPPARVRPDPVPPPPALPPPATLVPPVRIDTSGATPTNPVQQPGAGGSPVTPAQPGSGAPAGNLPVAPAAQVTPSSPQPDTTSVVPPAVTTDRPGPRPTTNRWWWLVPIGVVAAAALVLRQKKPDSERPRVTPTVRLVRPERPAIAMLESPSESLEDLSVALIDQPPESGLEFMPDLVEHEEEALR